MEKQNNTVQTVKHVPQMTESFNANSGREIKLNIFDGKQKSTINQGNPNTGSKISLDSQIYNNQNQTLKLSIKQKNENSSQDDIYQIKDGQNYSQPRSYNIHKNLGLMQQITGSHGSFQTKNDNLYFSKTANKEQLKNIQNQKSEGNLVDQSVVLARELFHRRNKSIQNPQTNIEIKKQAQFQHQRQMSILLAQNLSIFPSVSSSIEQLTTETTNNINNYYFQQNYNHQNNESLNKMKNVNKVIKMNGNTYDIDSVPYQQIDEKKQTLNFIKSSQIETQYLNQLSNHQINIIEKQNNTFDNSNHYEQQKQNGSLKYQNGYQLSNKYIKNLQEMEKIQNNKFDTKFIQSQVQKKQNKIKNNNAQTNVTKQQNKNTVENNFNFQQVQTKFKNRMNECQKQISLVEQQKCIINQVLSIRDSNSSQNVTLYEQMQNVKSTEHQKKQMDNYVADIQRPNDITRDRVRANLEFEDYGNKDKVSPEGLSFNKDQISINERGYLYKKREELSSQPAMPNNNDYKITEFVTPNLKKSYQMREAKTSGSMGMISINNSCIPSLYMYSKQNLTCEYQIQNENQNQELTEKLLQQNRLFDFQSKSSFVNQSESIIANDDSLNRKKYSQITKKYLQKQQKEHYTQNKQLNGEFNRQIKNDQYTNKKLQQSNFQSQYAVEIKDVKRSTQNKFLTEYQCKIRDIDQQTKVKSIIQNQSHQQKISNKNLIFIQNNSNKIQTKMNENEIQLNQEGETPQKLIFHQNLNGQEKIDLNIQNFSQNKNPNQFDNFIQNQQNSQDKINIQDLKDKKHELLNLNNIQSKQIKQRELIFKQMMNKVDNGQNDIKDNLNFNERHSQNQSIDSSSILKFRESMHSQNEQYIQDINFLKQSSFQNARSNKFKLTKIINKKMNDNPNFEANYYQESNLKANENQTFGNINQMNEFIDKNSENQIFKKIVSSEALYQNKESQNYDIQNQQIQLNRQQHSYETLKGLNQSQNQQYILPKKSSQDKNFCNKNINRVPNAIGTKANKHFPKDFFNLKKNKREGAVTSEQANRSILQKAVVIPDFNVGSESYLEGSNQRQSFQKNSGKLTDNLNDQQIFVNNEIYENSQISIGNNTSNLMSKSGSDREQSAQRIHQKQMQDNFKNSMIETFSNMNDLGQDNQDQEQHKNIFNQKILIDSQKDSQQNTMPLSLQQKMDGVDDLKSNNSNYENQFYGQQESDLQNKKSHRQKKINYQKVKNEEESDEQSNQTFSDIVSKQNKKYQILKQKRLESAPKIGSEINDFECHETNIVHSNNSNPNKQQHVRIEQKLNSVLPNIGKEQRIDRLILAGDKFNQIQLNNKSKHSKNTEQANKLDEEQQLSENINDYDFNCQSQSYIKEDKLDKGRGIKVNRNSMNLQDNNLYQGDTFRQNKEFNLEKRISANPSTEQLNPTNSQAFTEDYTNSRPLSRLSKDRTSQAARRKLNMNLQNFNQPQFSQFTYFQNSRDNLSLKSDLYELDKIQSELKSSKDLFSQKQDQEQININENISNKSKAKINNNKKLNKKQQMINKKIIFNENISKNNQQIINENQIKTIQEQNKSQNFIENQDPPHQESLNEQQSPQKSGQKQEIVNATFGGDQKFFQKQNEQNSQQNMSQLNSPDSKIIYVNDQKNEQQNQRKVTKIYSASLNIHDSINEQIVQRKSFQSQSSQDQYKFTSQSNQSNIKVQEENLNLQNTKSKTEQNSTAKFNLNQDLLNFKKSNRQESLNNDMIIQKSIKPEAQSPNPIINERLKAQYTYQKDKDANKNTPFQNQTPIIVKKHNSKKRTQNGALDIQNSQDQYINNQSQTINYDQNSYDIEQISGLKNQFRHHQKNNSQPIILLKSDSPERFHLFENRQQYILNSNQDKQEIQNINVQNQKSFQDIYQNNKTFIEQQSEKNIQMIQKSTETDIAKLLQNEKNNLINEYNNEYIYTQQNKILNYKKSKQVIQSCEIRKNPVIVASKPQKQIGEISDSNKKELNNYRLIDVKNEGENIKDEENNYFHTKQIIKAQKGKRKDGKMLTTDQNPLTYYPEQSITDSNFGNLSSNFKF